MENYLTKRNIIIAGVVAVIIIGLLLYFGLKNGTETGSGGFLGIFPAASPSGAPPGKTFDVFGVSTSDVKEGGAGELPLSPEAAKSLPIGTLIRLSENNISSLAPNGTTSVRYHKNIPENLGHLFERRADGSNEETRIANFTIPQILRVVWAPDGKRAVIFYNLDGQIRKLLADYSATTTRTNFLPDTVSDAAFSPDSKSLAFINDLPASPQGGGDSQNIFIASSDFKNQKKVFDNNVPGFEISWPAPDLISLKTKSSMALTGFLYALDPKTGSLSKIAEGRGLDAAWNVDGSGAIFSTVSSGGDMLNLKFADIKTGEIKDLGVKTIAEKCAFLKTLKSVAYCGVPKNSQNQLPDAWWQGKISFTDDFVAVDTSVTEPLFFVPTQLDITSPKPLANDSYLLFRDKSSGNLWGLKLKP